MIRKLFQISALCAALGATQVHAQEQSDSDTSVYDGLPVGALYFREDFSDWRLRCQKTADGNDPCQLHQYLLDSTGDIVAQVTVFNLNEPQGVAIAAANVTVPLETALREGIRMKIDDKQAKAYPFAYCDSVGCHARLGFTAVELKWLQDGAVAQVRMVPYAGNRDPLVLDLSLSGFTAGYTAVTDNNTASN